MTATLAPRLSKNVDRKVIVILKSQLAPAHLGSRAATLRSEVTTAYQTVRERPAPGVRLYGRACLVAALASWLSGERYVHREPTVSALVDSGDPGQVDRSARQQAVEPVSVAVHGGEPSHLGRTGRA